ncbi:MAG TPA: class I SAM-dependent methyltransferase [Terriglobales bacterium]|nr:class I SAM-dependent methyltransferase [Terriglobales bacterium]
MAEIATTSHATAMDRMYRYTRHIYDLTRKPYLLGRDRLIAELGLEAGGSVLEMGCGTGRNLIAVARAYPKAELYGFDISEEMLKTARAAISRAGLTDRIRLMQGDATAFDAAAFGREAFDRVYFSYTLSMVPPWRAALARGLALTKSGGRFSVVDFGFCEGLGGLPRAILHGWLKLFHVTPRAELEDELKALGRAKGHQVRFERPFGGYAQLGTVG